MQDEPGIVKSTFGRFIFNEMIPQDLGYVDRTDPEQQARSRVRLPVGKKKLEDIIARCIRVHGAHETARLLDDVKALGYKYSTKSGISIGIEDMIVPDVKEKMLSEADEKVEFVNKKYERGLLDEVRPL